MKKYTITDIASIYGVSAETVRRWVRSNKLIPIDLSTSKKEGYEFSIQSIKDFESNNKKYRVFTNDILDCEGDERANNYVEYVITKKRIDDAKAKLQKAIDEYNQTIEDIFNGM